MSEDMPRTVTVDDETILRQFSKVDCPVATVPDLSEHVPLGQDGLRHRLKQLEENNVVESRKVGSRAVVWWPNTQESC
jgi:predicted transcriptional regulator